MARYGANYGRGYGARDRYGRQGYGGYAGRREGFEEAYSGYFPEGGGADRFGRYGADYRTGGGRGFGGNPVRGRAAAGRSMGRGDYGRGYRMANRALPPAGETTTGYAGRQRRGTFDLPGHRDSIHPYDVAFRNFERG